MCEEEIINAFKHFVSKQGEGVILYNEDSSVIKLQDVVDLIAGQKAEIERLTEKMLIRDTNYFYNMQGLRDEIRTPETDKEKLISENTELQKLIDELRETLKLRNVQLDDIRRCNTELQKQVDELKQENSVLLVTVGLQEEIEKQAVKDTAQKIFPKLYEKIDNLESCLDTDYEPYYAAYKRWDVLDIIENEAKRYGVEVR